MHYRPLHRHELRRAVYTHGVSYGYIIKAPKPQIATSTIDALDLVAELLRSMQAVSAHPVQFSID